MIFSMVFLFLTSAGPAMTPGDLSGSPGVELQKPKPPPAPKKAKKPPKPTAPKKAKTPKPAKKPKPPPKPPWAG